MSDAVIASVITGGISLIGIIISTAWNAHNTAVKNDQNYQRLITDLGQQSREEDIRLQAKIETLQASTNIKIDELTREVREHNQFAQRLPVLEEKAKRTDRRLDDLERQHN